MKTFNNGVAQLLNEISVIGDRLKSELVATMGSRENVYIKFSKNENRLIEVIQNLGNEYIYSFKVPNSKFVADFYHTPSKTIIEVNGPSHYVKKFDGDSLVVTDQLNGRSVSKFNRLKSAGYNVSAINFQQMKVDATNEELKQLLESCIAK
jgi:very-short-patch-repair endonuclease